MSLSRQMACVLLGVMAVCGASAAPARGDMMGFRGATANSVADVGIGESQLAVESSYLFGRYVLFTFYNNGPLASSITDVYFTSGPLQRIVGFVDRDDSWGGMTGDSGVDFSMGAAPPDLPGGGDFEVGSNLAADSDPPTAHRGVDPNETLGVVVKMRSGYDYADVLEALANQDLRIGIHVQGFASGGSESFINLPPGNPPVIPAPGATVLAMIGLGMVGWMRRRNESELEN